MAARGAAVLAIQAAILFLFLCVPLRAQPRGGTDRLDFEPTFQIEAYEPDLVAPELMDLRFTPSAVDVRVNASSVLCNVTVADRDSGVDFVQVVLLSPSGLSELSVLLSPADRYATNSYSARLVLPPGQEPGQWAVRTVLAQDYAGNQQLYLQQHLDTTWGTKLSLQSTLDSVAPECSMLTVVTPVIDTDEYAPALVFELACSDLGTGVQSLRLWLQVRASHLRT